MQSMTREEALERLEAREGYPAAENEHVSTDALIAAASAPSGQPCADCQTLVVWREDLQDWRHVDPEAAARCFLGQGEGQR